MRHCQERAVLPGRGEVEGHDLALLDRLPVELRPREMAQRTQPGRLPGEDGHADVVEAVAGRLLEQRARVERSGEALVARLDRLACVEPRQPVGLAPQLGQRLVARIVPEQLKGDRRGDEPREHDPRQEEGRDAEAQRPEHGYTLTASLTGATL